MSSIRMSPNQREVIGAISTITGNQEYLTSTNGALNVNATVSIGANASVNVNQIAGTATSVGNGTTDAGTQRVTISSDSTGKITVTDLKSSSASVGQTKIASSGTAVQLASNVLNNGVIVTAKSTNSAAMTIGGSGVTNTVDGTGNGYILEAGSSTSFAVTNTNVLYVNGTSGDIVSFSGS